MQLCGRPATRPAISRANAAVSLGATGSAVQLATVSAAAEIKIIERMTCLLFLQRTIFAG